jgi:sec-independent protein translocase protein TatC
MSQNQTEMSIWDHLGELRRRLLSALIAMVVTTGVSFLVTNQFIAILAEPIGGLGRLQAIEVTETVGVYMKVALLSGLILAMPVIVYQLLSFIAPGLTDDERKWVYVGVPSASVLFLAGVLFCFYILLPRALPFLTNFMDVKSTPTISSYMAFVTNLLFWLGICFETPLLIFILAKFKVVSASQLLKFWRYAIIIIALIAAIVTPTVDPVNMSFLMAPLILLYFISIFLAFLARR